MSIPRLASSPGAYCCFAVVLLAGMSRLLDIATRKRCPMASDTRSADWDDVNMETV